MMRIINRYGIPDNSGTTTAPSDPPADMPSPVWQGEWVSNPALHAQWEYERSIPQEVTMRQARLALLGAGLLGGVDAAIASLPSPTKEAASIEWEYAAVVQRSSGLVPAMATALGMTSEQIDALFVAAANL